MGKGAVRLIMRRLPEGDLERSCELMEKRNLQANIPLSICGYIFAYVYAEMEKIIFKFCHELSIDQSSGVLTNLINTSNF